MPRLPDAALQYISLGLAVVAGFWAAIDAPATHQFEQTMRALDLTGPVLSPLSLLTDAAMTLVVMAAVYLAAMAIFGALGWSGRLRV